MDEKQIKDAKKYIRNNRTCLFCCFDYLSNNIISESLHIYAAFWPFYYENSMTSDVGSNIDFIEKKMFNDLMRVYGGYDIYFDKGDFISAFSVIKRVTLDSIKLIMCVDAYYCNWNLAYKNKHILHSLVVVGYDELNGVILCIDPFSGSEEIRELSIAECKAGYDNIRIIKEKHESKEIAAKDITAILLKNYNNENVRESFNQIIFEINQENNGTCIFDSDTPNTCTIIRKCREITLGRYGICLLLNSKRQQVYEYENIADLFYLSACKWQRVYMALMRLLISNRNKLDSIIKISGILKELSEIEINCGKCLEKVATKYE